MIQINEIRTKYQRLEEKYEKTSS